MALFELKQDTGSGTAAPWAPPTFKDCVAADIDAAFFEENEHADRHTVDGKDVLIVLEDDDLREHSAHWEAGAKQNFDTGLYTAHTILYIRVEDYGPKPKIGKQLVLDKGTKSQRTYTINLCQEESGLRPLVFGQSRLTPSPQENPMDAVSPTLINLIIFVLAIYVGYHVVWTVTPALHTPLMAVTNALSAVVVVGAMLAAALTVTPLAKFMGVAAVALAAVNIFGGFLVTRRMLEMFKKKERPAKAA